MNPKQFFMGRAIGLTALGVILFIGAGFHALNNYIYSEKQGEAPNYEPYRATLSGEFVCLPHTDTSGPQTEECAFGIKTDAGDHYALDFNLLSAERPEISGGEHFSATGLITPVQNLSSDHWQKYPIKGIFSVTDSFKKSLDN